MNLTKKATMSSIEIAKIGGVNHNDLLKAIKKMEPAWKSTTGKNFIFVHYQKDIPNGGKKKLPMYQLNQAETLYISTKFNDEARARLIVRWMELEQQQPCGANTELLRRAVMVAGSQARLARRIGISEGTMSDLLSGNKALSIRLILQVESACRLIVERGMRTDYGTIEQLMQVEDKTVRLGLYATLKKGGLL